VPSDLAEIPNMVDSNDVSTMDDGSESSQPGKVAVVTGGSAGLGYCVAQALLDQDYCVTIVGRSEQRLDDAMRNFENVPQGRIVTCVADLTDATQVQDVFRFVSSKFGRLDALVNCVGQSDRGEIRSLDVDRLKELFDQNVVSALLCCQHAITLLEKTGGVIVNVGSLAAKVSPRYLGGYAIAKHGLAALTGQLRLELKPCGIHVGLINPGPIRRSDAGSRYANQVDNKLPPQANQPGAGARIAGLDPQQVADQVVRMIRQRKTDILMPRYLRLLIAVGHPFPRLGDWLLLKFSSGKR
jgi:short-subunit dehydrogenase